jgi:putative peptide zinc metalloprotease protein
MEDVAPASELERRKQLKLLLRRDLAIEAHKYEGRTYYVIKDPVNLRYYRLKDYEHYLLQFLDGKRTLEDAQKAYEAHYRPDRLKLEDLEAFAQELLTNGLAQNDSPRAGKQLFDRGKKRRRGELLQTVTNILYIKVPLFDPDRLLKNMVRYTGWIFTPWFLLLSVAFMVSAGLLVATNFETFLGKLPDYHEFFSFKTVIYLWAALGVVKVIHEFGHGLSCKKFGGEVHEMGFLFLCFSPAMYCNVTDAWVLPSKWRRIVISSAGIYVELIIAAGATWVWWYSSSQPFVHNLSLSLMVVCSVSTFFFNMNPLMRYDGYYVLMDLLEIPNLRQRSNRFLANLALDWCLGVEVQPEQYMALWRRVLFVVYAIASYIYKWVITFTILYFMTHFLKPYGLEVIGRLLAVAALASMLGWPAYRLGKNIYKRGRLPDMKRWRVATTAAAALAVVLFLCLAPLPINRVGGRGLVQPHPDATAKLFIRYAGTLVKLNVHTGQHVVAGEELAVFRNDDVDRRLDEAETELRQHAKRIDSLAALKTASADDPRERDEHNIEISKEEAQRAAAAATVQALKRIREDDLVLRAPRDGVVGEAPQKEAVGRYYEKNPDQAFLTIDEPRRFRVCLPVSTHDFNRLREDLERQSPAAAETRRELGKHVTAHFDHTPLKKACAELAPGLHVEVDEAAGASPDQPVTFRADDQRLSTALDRLLEPLGLGYVVRSEPGQPHDGWLTVRPGHERGYPDGPRQTADLGVVIYIHGRDDHVFKGRVAPLPESEAKEVPFPLTSRAGGPVAVKAKPSGAGTLVPQAQQYLVYIDILDPDDALTDGNMAEVKINCQPETCVHWAWRMLNNTFDLRLL